MSNKFTFDAAVPAEARDALRPYLDAYAWLVPAWCHRVYVYWLASDGEDGDTDAEVNPMFDYRYAKLTFYANWLAGPPERRGAVVAHELLHIVTNPLMRYIRRVAKDAFEEDEPKLFAHVEEGLRERCEGVIEDLAQMIDARATRL